MLLIPRLSITKAGDFQRSPVNNRLGGEGLERDLCSKEFYSDDERYADLINGVVCGGEQIVKKEDLQPLDTQSGFYKIRGFQRIWQGKGRQFRGRDLIRRTAFGMN